MVQSPGTYHVLFLIHADAPAVAFATIACGILIRPGDFKTSRFWMAGFACALSLACKQTMAPIVVAIAVYLLVSSGWRAMTHFLSAAAAGGAILLASIFAMWPARDVWFNIWTLASSRPLKHDAAAILLEAIRSTRLDSLPAVLPLLFISAYSWRANVRQFALENRWLSFALCGIFHGSRGPSKL